MRLCQLVCFIGRATQRFYDSKMLALGLSHGFSGLAKDLRLPTVNIALR